MLPPTETEGLILDALVDRAEVKVEVEVDIEQVSLAVMSLKGWVNMLHGIYMYALTPLSVRILPVLAILLAIEMFSSNY